MPKWQKPETIKGVDMKMLVHIFSLALLLLVSGDVLAQQQAGPVIDDIHRRNNPSHPGYVGNNAATPVPPREVWQNKYGAIAADWSDNGGVGIAEDENSLRAARRVALQRCGTPRCKIVATATNSCLAGVHGIGGSAVGGGNTREEAISVAMNQCAPGAQCELRYAYCNVPVRIR